MERTYSDHAGWVLLSSHEYGWGQKITWQYSSTYRIASTVDAEAARLWQVLTTDLMHRKEQPTNHRTRPAFSCNEMRVWV